MAKPRISRKCEICKTRLRSIPFSCCVLCIESLISDWKRKHPPKPQIVEQPKEPVEVNMNACDVCGLSRDDERYRGHNCFEVIKQTGRSDLAAALLRKAKDASDAEVWKIVKEALLVEVAQTPKIAPEALAKTA